MTWSPWVCQTSCPNCRTEGGSNSYLHRGCQYSLWRHQQHLTTCATCRRELPHTLITRLMMPAPPVVLPPPPVVLPPPLVVIPRQSRNRSSRSQCRCKAYRRIKRRYPKSTRCCVDLTITLLCYIIFGYLGKLIIYRNREWTTSKFFTFWDETHIVSVVGFIIILVVICFCIGCCCSSTRSSERRTARTRRRRRGGIR